MSTPPSLPRRLATLAATGLTAAALLALPAGTAAAQPGEIRGTDARGAITDSYLVVFGTAVDGTAARPLIDRLSTKHRARVGFRYGSTLRGFSARMTRAQALRLSLDPTVAYVEQDRIVRAVTAQRATPSWGLDRVDQRSLPLNDSYTYPNSGTGVTAYVIDSGIRTTHRDFGGQAVWGTNTTGDGTNTDCNGHGTHVAGTVGGTAYGVAKAVRLVAVKVLDCSGSGSLSDIVAGVDWVTAHHGSGPAVANISLGAPGSSYALEQAVRTSISDGVVYSVASGNSNGDACSFTPARTAPAITVNASTSTDGRAAFSNFGSCTDIFAPGQSITSAWYTSDTATATVSGTSMAAPHVAGAAARILGATPEATPAQVWTTLSANATPNKITDPRPGSPDRLLHLAGGTAPRPSGGTVPRPSGGTVLRPSGGTVLRPSGGTVLRPSGGAAPRPSRCAPRTNGADVRIRDNRTVSSRITVSRCSGKASAKGTVKVRIKHTARGDLMVDLVSPTGAVVKLHNRKGGRVDNLYVTYPRNLSGYAANGAWRLRVRDAAKTNTGRIDTWTLDL